MAYKGVTASADLACLTWQCGAKVLCGVFMRPYLLKKNLDIPQIWAGETQSATST